MNPQSAEIPRLNEKDLADFTKLLKNGIYKELCRRKLINASQLNRLVSQETPPP